MEEDWVDPHIRSLVGYEIPAEIKAVIDKKNRGETLDEMEEIIIRGAKKLWGMYSDSQTSHSDE